MLSDRPLSVEILPAALLPCRCSLPLLRMLRETRRRLSQWPICPVTKAPSRKQHSATAMLDVTNILPLREGRMTARVRNIVLPVWLEAKQW